MPQPTIASRHVDQALNDFALAYLNQAQSSVARRAFPVVPSPRQSNKYHVYTKAFFLSSEARKRAPGTESAVRGYELSTDSFFADRYSIAVDVTEEDIANSDAVLDAEQDAVRLALHDIEIAEEVAWAAEAFAASKWGTTVTGGTNFTKWSDAAATPIEDVATGMKTIHKGTGLKPNLLVLGANVWYDGLMNHPDVLARMPDNAPRIVTEGFLANLFGIDEVLLANQVRNSADEGATASYDFTLGSHALLCYRNPNPGPRSATAGATFLWTGLQGASEGYRVKNYPIEEKSIVARIEVDTAFDHKIVGSDLGYFFSTAV
jgi:hypothetical protein